MRHAAWPVDDSWFLGFSASSLTLVAAVECKYWLPLGERWILLAL